MNATPANPEAMSIDLSSSRVRAALTLLEGLRNGQTLGALLGYVFERSLHEAYAFAEVDAFIYPLRQAFPLAGNQLKSTATDGTVDVRLVEARNVVDGVALVARAGAHPGYPFALPTGAAAGQLPVATATQKAAIDGAIQDLLDLNDALADLVMTESVYQTVLGNFDRAAAVATAFNQGAHPPEMQVVDTPRNGLQITHRVALQFDAQADATVSPTSVPLTPRARAEAPLNRWLASRMPAPEQVAVVVTLASPALPGGASVTVTQAQLGLQAIDVLNLFNLELDQAMAELDDRIVQAVRYGAQAHPDLAVTIAYTQPVPGSVSFFELAALVRDLRIVVLKSRTLQPTDLALPLESQTGDDVLDDAELAGRVDAAATALGALHDALAPLVGDGTDLDTFAANVSSVLLKLALHGVPQTGSGQIHGDIRAAYDAIATRVKALADRWTHKRDACATLLAGYAALTTDADRFALLRQAEGTILAQTTAQPPADPAVYKAAVDAALVQFDADLATAVALGTWNGAKLVDFAAAVQAFVPVAALHDAASLDIGAQLDAIATQRTTLETRVASVLDDLVQRRTDAATALAATDNAPGSLARVQELLGAARRVLGDEMLLVPHFKLSADHAAEFANATAGSDALLTDLRAAGRKFPVDDWLYGLARVRPKLAAWESAAMLSEAFGAAMADLTPVQLPYVAGDRWAALEFDTTAASPNNRLLYTAHHAVPFDATLPQCGLLVDDWPEVVPAKDVLSGVAFHFERPSSQPPQAMILAVPPVLRGRWNWDDLVATLDETLDAAKARAVEPAQIDTTPYAQMLPATLMAVTLYQITIATNLTLNNRIYDFIKAP